MNARIDHEITLDEVRRAAVESGMIFYGANTCWWTCKPGDLRRHPDSGLPCDPRGGVLFEAHEPERFFEQAGEHLEHYGRHGWRALLLAYHGCVVVDGGPRDGMPTCFQAWEDYNALLDAREEGS